MVTRRKAATVDADLAAASAILGDVAQRDEAIGARTTYRVGGSASLYVLIDDEFALERVVDAVARTGVDVLVLGNGSNLLISDAGFYGLCVSLGGPYREIQIDHLRAAVQAGGGASLPAVARQSAAAALTGLEWAVGVPGSVGGAVAMNAGGHGSDTSERLVSAHIVGLADRTSRILTPRELNLSYRRSVLSSFDLVLSATFFLDPGDAEKSSEKIAEIVRWRREHQPGGRNAGSIFKNPTKAAAGQLIEQAGLKGMRVGSAAVSEKHANFFQVDDGGRADDVFRLIGQVRDIVMKRSGVELTPEVRFAGFGGQNIDE